MIFLFLKGRRAQDYYINEGLLSTLPAIALSLFGILAGFLLKDVDVTPRRKTVRLLAFGAAGIALGLLWSLQFPLIKRIWTSSFILVARRCSVPGCSHYSTTSSTLRIGGDGGEPFVWIGCNALIVYLRSADDSFRENRQLPRRWRCRQIFSTLGSPMASAP